MERVKEDAGSNGTKGGRGCIVGSDCGNHAGLTIVGACSQIFPSTGR